MKTWRQKKQKIFKLLSIFTLLKCVICPKSRCVTVVTKAVRSFNVTSLYSRNSKVTGHRQIVSEALKEPINQTNKRMLGASSRPNEPGSLRSGNQEYAFIYRTWPSLKATAFYHNPTTVNPTSTWNNVVMRNLYPRRQPALVS